ncbi:MAG: hypothetical protein HKP58_07520 [Desulfatitalea sp.]|nr:hypothetical protein [Desulfatitalea sp.]
MLGFKCQRCGAWEFPPVYCCNNCSGTDMQWAEISGKGRLLDFVCTSPISDHPENTDLKPYCLGSVELAEGPSLYAIVQGVSKKNKKEMNAKLPISVKAEIVQRDGFRSVVFRVVDE